MQKMGTPSLQYVVERLVVTWPTGQVTTNFCNVLKTNLPSELSYLVHSTKESADVSYMCMFRFFEALELLIVLLS